MVTGIERWKEYFNDYKDKYVLIGGAACNLLEEELDMNPRATKDLDLVLVVEALTPDFGARLWDFIKSANYADRSKGENEFKHEYYLIAMLPQDTRFSLPEKLKNDMSDFYQRIGELPNSDFFKNAGLRGLDAQRLLDLFNTAFL